MTDNPLQDLHDALRDSSPPKYKNFEPVIIRGALATRVLVVAKTRIEGTWAAYVDAVPGVNHDVEQYEVLEYGTKLPEQIARFLFPMFADKEYAR